MKLNITAFGLALGWLAALGIVGYTILAATIGWGVEVEPILESMYPGYTLSIPGAIIGAIWIFGIWYVIGVVFAWMYNKLTK